MNLRGLRAGLACTTLFVDIAVATHKGAGFEFVWRGRGGAAAEDLATFTAILATVRFAS
jgi:hypothetical protein